MTKWLLHRLSIMTGLLDAILIAGCGFLLNWLSARCLSTTQYGLFTMLYTLASLSLIFQTALISNPYVVLSQSITKENQSCYFTGTLCITVGLGLLLGLMSALISLIYLDGVEQRILLCGLFAGYILLNLIQDFMRRHFYSIQNENQSLLLDCVSYGGQILLIAWLGTSLTIHQLFEVLSGTSILAIAMSAMLNHKLFLPLIQGEKLSRTIKQTFQKNWEFGRWILLSNTVSWTANQICILALGLWYSPTIVAQLSVARTLAATSNPLILAYEAVGMPKMARLLNLQGPTAVKTYALKTGLLGGLLFVVLGLFFFMFPLQTIHLIYGKSFGNISLLVQIFSVLPLLWFIGKVFSIALLAMQQSKKLFPTYLIACTVTLTLGLWLTATLGALGAGIGFLLNGIILSAGFGVCFFKAVNTKQSTPVLEGTL